MFQVSVMLIHFEDHRCHVNFTQSGLGNVEMIPKTSNHS